MKHTLYLICIFLSLLSFGQTTKPYFGAGIEVGKDKSIVDVTMKSPAWEAGMEKCLYGKWFITAISNTSTNVVLPKVKKNTDIDLVSKGLIGQQGTTISISVKESKTGEKATFNVLLDYVNCFNNSAFKEIMRIERFFPGLGAKMIKDQDLDGVNDCEDACPTEKGEKTLKGCPAKDSDSDGIPDHLDKCPQVFGKAEHNGCPPPEIKPIEKQATLDLCGFMEKIILDYPNGFDNVRDTADSESEDGILNELKFEIPDFVTAEILKSKDDPTNKLLRAFNGFIVYGKNAAVAKAKYNEFLEKFSQCKSEFWTYSFNTEERKDGFKRTDITIYNFKKIDGKPFKGMVITLWVHLQDLEDDTYTVELNIETP